jgi:iron(III) transport system ATP-binding protein
MPYVRASGLTKTFAGKPPVTVVDGLDLEIEEGEFLVLLGPSGCGKTTTLRCLAGLETPTAGRIELGGRTVFDGRTGLPPDRRDIGMVFQSYALWPHLTVRRNIAYPLKARGLKEKIKEGWVEEMAEMVGCEALLDRYPAQLSGGQQQRVALARGLVARPGLVLFDEPLSNLDARLRDSVRAQLHELHGRLKFTAVFVTHDQSEALALGDRLAIMRGGAIEQLDTPERVFERPATEYAADFMGLANRLIWDGKVVRLRPDDLSLVPAGSPQGPGLAAVPARVIDTGYGGHHIDVVVQAGDDRLHARVPADDWARALQAGEDVEVTFDPAIAAFYDGQGRYSAPAAAVGAS